MFTVDVKQQYKNNNNHMAVADDVFGGDRFCVDFPNMVSLVFSGIEFCRFLRIILLMFTCFFNSHFYIAEVRG